MTTMHDWFNELASLMIRKDEPEAREKLDGLLTHILTCNSLDVAEELLSWVKQRDKERKRWLLFLAGEGYHPDAKPDSTPDALNKRTQRARKELRETTGAPKRPPGRPKKNRDNNI